MSKVLACIALLCAALAVAAPAAVKAAESDDAAALKLIEALKAADFEARQKATNDLRALGKRAQPALEKALKEDKDPELQSAIAGLLKELGAPTLSCEVYDRYGKPRAGVKFQLTLTAYSQAGKPEVISRDLVTDAEGRARVEGLQPGSYYPQLKWLNAFAADRFEHTGQIVLEPGTNILRRCVVGFGTVQGQLLDATTGRAVGKAEVALLEDRGLDLSGLDLDHPDGMGGTEHLGRVTEWLETDADGQFTIPSVCEGSQFLFVRHEAYICDPIQIGPIVEGQVFHLKEPLRAQSKAAACGTVRLQIAGVDGKPLSKGSVQILAQKQRSADEERAWKNNREFRLLQSRYTARKWGNYGGWKVFETTAEGTLELKGLRPGNYQFRVQLDGAATASPLERSIKAGVTAELAFPAPGPGGEITGLVKDKFGTPARSGQIFLLAEDDPEFKDLTTMSDPYFYRFQHSQSRGGPQCAAKIQPDGSFSFTHVAPGRYSLFPWLGLVRSVWIHPIEVSEGRVTRIPDIMPPAEKTPPKAPAKTQISAKIKGPDGQPCGGARCVFDYHGGARGMQANANGEFSISVDLSDVTRLGDVRLQVFHTGCQPFELELTKPGLDVGHLQIDLEKQQYGQLKVSVVDKDGHPLANCEVSVEPPNNNFEENVTTVPVKTNRDGQVELQGIAIGKRKLNIQKEGFLVDVLPEIVIEKDAAKSMRIEMHRRPVIHGSVSGIPKEEWGRVRIVLDAAHGHQQFHRACGLDAEGHFSISDLLPGLYMLRAEAPGWIEEDITLIGLEHDLSDVVLKLCKPGCLKLEAGQGCRGFEGTLCQPGEWDPFNRAPRAGLNRVTDYEMREMRAEPYKDFRLNSAGNANVFGIKPGAYDLLLKPYEDSMGYTRHDLYASHVCKNINVPVVPAGAGNLAAVPAIPVAIKPGTAAVNGLIRWKDANSNAYEGVYEDLELCIVGNDTVAKTSFRLDELVTAKDAAADDPKSVQNRFVMRGLPAGDYRLAWRFNLLDEELSYIRKELPPERRTDRELPLVLLKSFHLDEGQTLDLGEFVYEPDAETRKLLIWDYERDHRRSPVGTLVGRDVPAFKP